jgi:hypothetical protein
MLVAMGAVRSIEQEPKTPKAASKSASKPATKASSKPTPKKK